MTFDEKDEIIFDEAMKEQEEKEIDKQIELIKCGECKREADAFEKCKDCGMMICFECEVEGRCSSCRRDKE